MAQTKVLPCSADSIREAARLIREGQPVAVPTETVYGLAANARDGEAVARIYQAKGRPSFNPLIVHVPDLEAAGKLAEFGAEAEELARRYWPGPLTLVLPLRRGSGIAALVTAGLPTIALRVPAHPVMRAMLAETGLPLAAPSANRSGRISPSRPDHVVASLDGLIPLVLDAGPTEMGIESTIVAATGDGLRLLRPGPIDLGLRPAGGGKVESPGQLESHYAPRQEIRLDARERREGEWLIGFGPVGGDSTLSEKGDLVEAAARLFDRLHQAERQDRPLIAVAPIPDHGIGQAINDRLRRAAAPRNPGATGTR